MQGAEEGGVVVSFGCVMLVISIARPAQETYIALSKALRGEDVYVGENSCDCCVLNSNVIT